MAVLRHAALAEVQTLVGRTSALPRLGKLAVLCTLAADAGPSSHVAFKIGNLVDELREAKLYLEAAGVEVIARDHGVSKSIYCKDPDNNTIELCIDASDVWKH